MNTSNLNLIFFDNPDPKTIYLQDVSSYNPDLPVELPMLVITPPNFQTSYSVFYPVHSLMPINSNLFGWTNIPQSDPEMLSKLQDGIWRFNQSIKPNGLIKRDYIHFRVVNLKYKIYAYVSDKIDSDNAYFNPDDPWYGSLFRLLQILDTAKYLAEKCGKCEEASIMYNTVDKQFSRISNC